MHYDSAMLLLVVFIVDKLAFCYASYKFNKLLSQGLYGKVCYLYIRFLPLIGNDEK